MFCDTPWGPSAIAFTPSALGHRPKTVAAENDLYPIIHTYPCTVKSANRNIILHSRKFL